MNEGDDKNIDEIRRDIEDTRLRISTEIEEIEERLTPAHAKEMMMEKVNETRHRVTDRIGETGHRVADRIGGTASIVRSNATRVGSDFGAAVRTNPIPVALIGLGTGWLVWETVRPIKREIEVEPLFELDVDVEPGYSEGYGESGFVTSSGDGQRTSAEARAKLADAKNRASGIAQNAKQRASGIANVAKDRAYGAKDRASHLAHDARDRASHLAHDARDRSRMVAERSRERALRARSVTSEAYDSNPIAFGALALAAGVGLALLLPHTRREDRTFGRARERVVTKAKQFAEQGKEIAKDSVREGAHAARETAKREAEERHLVR